jgi:hypothetical protein
MAKCESQMSDHSKALNQIRNMLGEPKTRSLDLDSPEVEASFMRKLEEKFEARIIELQTQNLQRMAVPSQKAVASDPIGLDDKDSSAGSESKTQLDDLTPEAYAMELYRTQNLNN